MSRKREPQRKMQPRPRPKMPATTPTVPLPTSGATPRAAARSILDAATWQGFQTPKCCHDPTEAVIEISGVPIYLADGWGSRKAPIGSVVLNCTGIPKFDGAELPASFASLRAHLDEPRVEEITLSWVDGGVPPVKDSFWRALIEACAARGAPLVIHCVGGHGRTGTAMAAILIAYSIPADDAIEFVREHHCSKAIETLAQERYLAELDWELNEKNAKPDPEPES